MFLLGLIARRVAERVTRCTNADMKIIRKDTEIDPSYSLYCYNCFGGRSTRFRLRALGYCVARSGRSVGSQSHVSLKASRVRQPPSNLVSVLTS